MSVGYLRDSKHVLSDPYVPGAIQSTWHTLALPSSDQPGKGELAVRSRLGVPANTSPPRSVSLESRALGSEGRRRASHGTSRGDMFAVEGIARATAQKQFLVPWKQPWGPEWG